MELSQTQSQKNLIRNLLLQGESITPLDALRDFGCFRLASRISDLRSEGMNITKRMVERRSWRTGRIIRFASYSLDNATPEAVRGQQK